MENKLSVLRKFWKNKKVFLTGHTGFKGCWFSIFLNLLGAKVIGYSLKPDKKLNLFDLAKLDKEIYGSIIGDIRNYNKLKRSIAKFCPNFIVHMAAQPLVRYSYDNPRYTYEVNTLGTVNILNILNEINFIKFALIITTDKVYFNNNKKSYYSENDLLGGLDPYSNSKSCAELAINSYNHSFLRKKNIYVATARAGNVIGGGDFSTDRVFPDYFRSLSSKDKSLFLRSPNSVRPWQLIIDPLYGYLLLLMKLHKKKRFQEYCWNFGPEKSNNKSVSYVVNLMNKEFNNSVKVIKKNNNSKNYFESKLLMLNSEKSKKTLNWKSKYNIYESIKLISYWHKDFLMKKNILKICQDQILNYFK
ncbi:MAG: CDP-glucose 4,6-dehydratase [Gammaproteobacteria bacterium]|nr:CDP-glucose 4,6-dehydratase [Gammaproteobacteria bacterium]